MKSNSYILYKSVLNSKAKILKSALFFFLLTSFNQSIAQWTLGTGTSDAAPVFRTGNVGIGYGANPNSTFKLDVNGNSLFTGTVEIRNNVYLNGSSLTFRSASNFPITFASRNTSGYLMDLQNIGAFTANSVTLKSKITLLEADGTDNGDPITISRYKSTRAYGNPGFSDFRVSLGNLTDGSDRFHIGSTSTAGIFTPMFEVSSAGVVTTKKVVVTQAAFADYVFDENYKLSPLKEVENYIKENKHLPGIPSATEVYEKGLDTAEMLKLQMEKIEELTLHLIAQQKKIEDLEKLISK